MLTEVPALTHPAVAEYLEHVEQLYADVERWLPAATFTRSTTHLSEMATGPYTAPVLEVARTDGYPLRFVPVARYMLGGCGMVEVHGIGMETLVWVLAGAPKVGHKFPPDGPPVEDIGGPERPEIPEGWVWADERHLDLIPLDRDVFLDGIVETLS